MAHRTESLVKPCSTLFILAFLTPHLFSSALISTVMAAEDSAQVYFFHALKSKEEGRILTAERLLRKAIEIEPENPDFHFELGNLYIERNDLQAARLELEQAAMIAPRHLAAHYNLGLVYRELGLMGEARDQFRRLLDLDPNNVKAQLQIGYTYQKEKFFEDARQAFETAQEMDRTNPEPAQALEDLSNFEAQARERSRNSMEESLFRNQQLLNQQTEFASPPQSSSGRGALMQAGALLIQELLSRRSQTLSKDERETRLS